MMPAYPLLILAVLAREPQSALVAAWWWVLGKKVRARSRLKAAAAKIPFSHQTWLKLNQPKSPDRRKLATARKAGEGATPFWAIHLHVPSGGASRARDAIISVLQQSLPNWHLFVTMHDNATQAWPDFSDPRIAIIPGQFESSAAALTALLVETSATYFIPLDHSRTLAPGALEAYQAAISGCTRPHPILYADQDERGASGQRTNPWFKPQWDLNLFLSQDYLSAACAIPLNAMRQNNAIDPLTPDCDLAFSILVHLLVGSDDPPAIVHVPYICVTCPADSWKQPGKTRIQIIRALLGRALASRRLGQVVGVEKGPFGTLSIRHAQSSCSVSIIVPTRDKVELLRTCLSGVLTNTDYPNFEVIVIDNGSVEPETFDYFREVSLDPRIRVLEWPQAYNYSAINNFAVTKASGAYLCLLNNDTEIVSADWLDEMMRQAVRPGVGAVGARLLYPDRSIQHAGVVVGMGNAAGHAHRFLPEGDAGYFAQAYVSRGATAVTAACLVVSKQAFETVGGLDEVGLKIAYNDIDFCLKLRAQGLVNIYEPRAVLIHHESKSRGLDFSPENLARYMSELRLFQGRWKTIGFADPMHHSALDPACEAYRARLISSS